MTGVLRVECCGRYLEDMFFGIEDGLKGVVSIYEKLSHFP
jgi:hypothetical protein